jgi:hypothetical protein
MTRERRAMEMAIVERRKLRSEALTSVERSIARS